MAVDMTEVATWLSVRTVAARLGVSDTQVFRLLNAGRLAGVRTQVGWLMLPASVAAYETERLARKVAKAC